MLPWLWSLHASSLRKCTPALGTKNQRDVFLPDEVFLRPPGVIDVRGLEQTLVKLS